MAGIPVVAVPHMGEAPEGVANPLVGEVRQQEGHRSQVRLKKYLFLK